MTEIISFSGGKDSTALVLWAKEHFSDFTVIFCDTGWEHPATYEYIEYINKTVLDSKLVVLKSDAYDGFEELSIKKKRIPSVCSRYCTQELKIFPAVDYVKAVQDDHKLIYVGIRADESKERAKMPIANWDDTYECVMVRPLLHWKHEDVFSLMKRHNIKPNPLYKMGLKRVGCMPCIMITLPELYHVVNRFPWVVDKIRSLEQNSGSSFFTSGKIPKRYCKQMSIESKKHYPLIDDVYKYLMDTKGAPLFNDLESFIEAERGCMSYFGVCE